MREIAPARLLAVLILAAAWLPAGCARTRGMRFESTVPAVVKERNGAVICASTPCEWRFSRETCWGFDSSLGYFGVSAVAPDGTRLDSPMLKTCSVREGTLIRFRFPAPGSPGGVDVE